MGLGTPAKDFVNSILAVVTPAFTLPVLKSILYDGSSSIKVENIVRLILFLLFTPTIILAQLMLMAWVKPTIHAIELGAFLMENTVADNFMMMIASWSTPSSWSPAGCSSSRTTTQTLGRQFTRTSTKRSTRSPKTAELTRLNSLTVKRLR